MIDVKIGRRSGKLTLDYLKLKFVAQLEKNFEKMLFMAGLEMVEGLENPLERIEKIKIFKEENDIKISVDKSLSGADVYTMSKRGVDIAMFGVKTEFDFVNGAKMIISEVKKL